MSWFSKFFTPAAPAPVPSRPAPARPPAPTPAPLRVSTPPPAPAAPRVSASSPAAPPPAAGGRARGLVAPVAKPPWFPNEGPALEAAANSTRQSIRELDAVVADLHHSFAAVDWFGPDAEQFRARWRNEQSAVAGTRSTLSNLEASLRHRAMEESTRFRVQESS
jgi:uncharacterized protein YukE